jgi:hypothetical protein
MIHSAFRLRITGCPEDDMTMNYELMMKYLPLEWVTDNVIEKLYGIKMPDDKLFGTFQSWSSRLKSRRNVLRPGEVNRHAFESYLQYSHLMPIKIAAARLGMSADSLREIIDLMDSRNIIVLNTRDFSEQLVYETLIREFNTYFPGLQNRIFNDHNDYCRRLQEAVSSELDVTIEPMYCVFSEFLKENPPDFAYDYDCLTGEPVGLRYQVWLNFNKPIYLRPDICSLKTYIDHKEELRPLVFSGKEPEIPDSLSHG